MIDLPFAICALAVMAGALLQGTGGIGFAMVAAPIVAIVRPDMVPGPMIVAGGTISLLIALREHRSIDRRGALIALGGRVPGAILAGLVIGLLPHEVFAISFALLVIAAVILSLAGWKVQPTAFSLAAAGFGSGVMGTITSVGAPPMGIVLQNATPPVLRATTGAFLFAGGMVSLIVLAAAGRFGWHELQLGLLLLLPMAIGFRLSSALLSRFRSDAIRYLVLAVSGLSAVILLAQNLMFLRA